METAVVYDSNILKLQNKKFLEKVGYKVLGQGSYVLSKLLLLARVLRPPCPVLKGGKKW